MALSRQHLAYCDARAFGQCNPLEAFRKAYDVSKLSVRMQQERADLLESRQDIQDRINVLNARAGDKAASALYSLADAMAEAEEVRILATKKGQAAAAKSAVELKAKLSGLIVEKKEVKQTHGLETSDIDDLKAMQAALQKAIRDREAIESLTGTVEIPTEIRKIA